MSVKYIPIASISSSVMRVGPPISWFMSFDWTAKTGLQAAPLINLALVNSN